MVTNLLTHFGHDSCFCLFSFGALIPHHMVGLFDWTSQRMTFDPITCYLFFGKARCCHSFSQRFEPNTEFTEGICEGSELDGGAKRSCCWWAEGWWVEMGVDSGWFGFLVVSPQVKTERERPRTKEKQQKRGKTEWWRDVRNIAQQGVCMYMYRPRM